MQPSQNTVSKGIELKIFVGFPLSSNLKYELGKSHEWKEASFTKKEGDLLEIYYQDKNYIGRYSSFSEMTLQQIDDEITLITDKIKILCPDLSLDSQSITLISQAFIS